MQSQTQDVSGQLGAMGVVPVVVISDADKTVPLCQALIDGGLAGAEITLRTPAGLEALRQAANVPGFLAGAGTVLTAQQADQAIAAGARFLVSPGLSAAVVRVAQEAGITVIPGVATATELMAARDLGVSTVKFFPAGTSGGAAAVRALADPFGDMRFMPTGGVRPENLSDYLALPAVFAVGGTWITPTKALLDNDFEQVARFAGQAAELVRRHRSAPDASTTAQADTTVTTQTVRTPR